MALQGVIFDMDGLIFDTEQLYYQATQDVADEMGFAYDFSLYEKFIGVSDEELWLAYHEMYDEIHGKETVVQFIDRAFTRGLELFENGLADLKPGVRELLAYLDEKQIPRVIASSNQRQVIDILLAKNDLAKEFDAVVSFEDVARAKPDPEIFEKAQQFLNIPKENLLILEDSKNGILAAHSAGIDVIMIPDLLPPTPELEERTLAVFDSLLEIPAFLEK
ncbi:HAD family phosphatase [Enterococcus saccharolyticus]|uniref:HAD family hydrolase n=1 Tax=Candidatus Enterococcus willemsii TaxID=1857215 RepID=A0ABQ6YZ89_9ENTE|nr:MULTISPECIES: HAD family phosphatase [Enterococcus]KAF1303764.1 HAD family hydrolase [Enterococcus sp. CU12B]MCD5003289.1 HAD family phosphatase [Enterococcus saccharolyticus]